jgi:transposase
MEDWVTIRNLKKRNSDLGTREIARIMRISRNTVKSALRNNSAPQYKRQEKINPEIKPFENYISDTLGTGRFRKSRILEDIISKGYEGSKSAFYRHCSKIILPESRSYKPYETAPGLQAQFDWSPYTIVVNGNLIKVYVYSYIHGFSRFRIYEASLSQTLGSVFEALENSIIESGGVCERLQTDNAKCFVNNASRDNFAWNKRYLAFCGHYGFKPTRSLPGHPWSKGKVERPFDYLEEHFIKGNEFSSFEEFITKLKAFQDKVNARVHSTTKVRPDELFEKEKPSLAELPRTRYVGTKEEVRKVTADCLISYAGSRYSVPYLFATREVWVKVSKGYFIEIYSSHNKLIAKHRMSLKKGKVVMVEEHYKSHSVERGNWNRLSKLFTETFSLHDWFPEKLKTQKRINPNYHITRIMDMAEYYNHKDMEKAFDKCLQFNIYNASFIRAYLDNNASGFSIEPLPIETMTRKEIAVKDIHRPLDYYNIKGINNGPK